MTSVAAAPPATFDDALARRNAFVLAAANAFGGANASIVIGSGGLVGMMLALVFYNFLLYFATSKLENIFYSFYLISGLVWIALSYGLVASLFDVYGEEVFMLNILEVRTILI